MVVQTARRRAGVRLSQSPPDHGTPIPSIRRSPRLRGAGRRPGPALARAYLALADDPGPALAQRSLPRALLALLATLVLAVAAPLAWASAARGDTRDVPAATTVKATDADEDDGDEDDPAGGDGSTWAATDA